MKCMLWALKMTNPVLFWLFFMLNNNKRKQEETGPVFEFSLLLCHIPPEAIQHHLLFIWCCGLFLYFLPPPLYPLFAFSHITCDFAYLSPTDTHWRCFSPEDNNSTLDFCPHERHWPVSPSFSSLNFSHKLALRGFHVHSLLFAQCCVQLEPDENLVPIDTVGI